MARYILSPEAQRSLKNIREYSIKNFGNRRTKTYLKNIRKRMQELAENSSLGTIREDLKVGYHSHFVGSHTIYYRVKPTHIDIIDVLHQSMEPSKHIIN